MLFLVCFVGPKFIMSKFCARVLVVKKLTELNENQ